MSSPFTTNQRVYAVCDKQVCLAQNVDPYEYCYNLIEAGIRIIQLRDKLSAEKDYWEFFYKVLGWRITQQTATVVIANEYAKSWHHVINKVLDHSNYGFHGGQSDLLEFNLDQLMKLKVKHSFIFGVSVHNYAEWQNVKYLSRKLNYIGYGRMFSSLTKPNALESENFISTKWLVELSIPVYFIGGITLENFHQIDKTCHSLGKKNYGFAIASDLLSGGCSTAKIRNYLAEIDATSTVGGEPIHLGIA